MTKIPSKTWVMVGDGEKALFLRNDGDDVFPNLTVVREMSNDNPSTREQGTDAPGRLSDGPGPHSSAVEETDWHRIEKARFAHEIAERLYKATHRATTAISLWRRRRKFWASFARPSIRR